MRILFLFILAFVCVIGSDGSGISACEPSQFSTRDAERLVMATPEGSDAQKNAFHTYAFIWVPKRGDIRHFYFVELDQKEGESTPLGNGLIGHFAVNRRSGDVVNMDSVQVEHGPKLQRLREALRREHCISAAITSAESDRLP